MENLHTKLMNHSKKEKKIRKKQKIKNANKNMKKI